MKKKKLSDLFPAVRVTRASDVLISLTLPSIYLLDTNKIGEHWPPRITDKVVMIGSQFIHMFTTSLGRHIQ